MERKTVNQNGMSWDEFEKALKRLSKRLWLNTNYPVRHSAEHPDIVLVGLWYGRKHICSVAWDHYVPHRDEFDGHGVMLRQGLKSILRNLLAVEFVPNKNATLNMAERHRGHYFKAQISPADLKKAFGVFRVEDFH